MPLSFSGYGAFFVFFDVSCIAMLLFPNGVPERTVRGIAIRSIRDGELPMTVKRLLLFFWGYHGVLYANGPTYEVTYSFGGW